MQRQPPQRRAARTSRATPSATTGASAPAAPSGPSRPAAPDTAHSSTRATPQPRARALKAPPDHAPSVSASMHTDTVAGDTLLRSVSRNNLLGTSLIDDLFQIQRSGVFSD